MMPEQLEAFPYMKEEYRQFKIADASFAAAMREELAARKPPPARQVRKATKVKRDWLILTNAKEETMSQMIELAREIILETAIKHKLKKSDITGESRKHKIVRARQEAIVLVDEKTSLSTTAIARIFGGRDHTTILHSLRKKKGEMK